MFRDIYYYFKFPREPRDVAERLVFKFKNRAIRFAITDSFQKQVKWSKFSENEMTVMLLRLCASAFTLSYYYFLDMARKCQDDMAKNYSEETALELKKAYTRQRIKEGADQDTAEMVEISVNKTIEICNDYLSRDKYYKNKELEIGDYISVTSKELYVALRHGKPKKKDKLEQMVFDYQIGNFKAIESMYTNNFKNHWHKALAVFKEKFWV